MAMFCKGVILLVFMLGTVRSYSKYGRKCEDIGCASNEECVMASKSCSYFDRQDECGEYPTCKKISNSARTCATYVCPPSKVCKMDSGIPKCFDDTSKVGNVPLYDTSNINSRYDGKSTQNNPSAPSSGGYNPSAPSAPRADGGSIYPNIGGNTGSNYGNTGYRPQGGYPNNGYQQPTGHYGGYQQPGGNYGGYQQPGYNQNTRPGGYSGSGSTGYNQGGYRPQQGGGYNGYQQQAGGYNPNNYHNPNNQYPQLYTTQVPAGYYVAGAGYQQPASGGYGSQPNRYQNTGYGYNQGSQGYSGYGNTGYGQHSSGQNKYGYRNNASSSFSDSLKEALKKIGSDFLQKTISGSLKRN